jgi:hypothetical protein
MVLYHQVPVASLTLLLLKFTLVAVGVPVRTAHRVVVIMTVFRTATYNMALGDNVGATKIVSWVTIYNINPIHLIAVIEITAIGDTMSSIASPSNDQVLPIEDNPIAEDIVPIVDSMANWVAIQQWLPINKPTIVDVATMSAAASFV